MIRLQVRAGFGAMPAFPTSRISDRELDDMVAYVMALRALKPNPADLERPAGGSRAE
jgi:mono/diheme cytochrome c family protein